MHRIIVLDNLAPEGLEILAAAEGVEHHVQTGLKGEELRQALTEFDGAVCRSGVKITADSLTGNRRLRAIVRAGVGTDNIDKQAATRQGVVVMNTPTGNTVSTAEHAIALMLGLSRNLHPAYQSLIEGRWDRKTYMGAQLADKTLGVIGLGRIGVEVAKRALAFQMRVLGYDPFMSRERAEELGIELVAEVAEMLPRVDYLTVHTPLTPETKGLINRETLQQLKPGARLINAARGGIYEEQALAAGLESGRLAGVALDVFEEEPTTDSPLFGKPGVLCTPHLGASTEEAQTQVAVEAVNLLLGYLIRGEIRHAVNVAAVDPKTLASLRGFLNLAYRMGMFAAQWGCRGASGCRLNYRGEVADRDTRLLTAAFCAGLLEGALDEEVNIVNAEMLLRERGVGITEESSDAKGAFRSSMTVKLATEDGEFTLGGTLFGHDMPRLIRVQDYRLEAYLDGILLLFEHQDVPGIIGAVGTVFGRHNVNIGQMAVGRSGGSAGGHSIGVLNLDSRPPEEAIADVLALDHIESVQVIELPAAGSLPRWLLGS